MTGYRDKSEVFGPRDRPSRGEWLTLGVAVLMTAAILVSAIADRHGPDWLKHLGIAPVGIAEFMFAWTFFARARLSGKGERFTPRQLRGVAYIFVALGVLTVAFSLISNS
jgi:hypothetical protein